MQKKAQISPSVFMGVLTVVIILIVLGILFAVSQKSISTIKTTVAENKQTNISNEKITFANNTNTAFGQKFLVTGSVVVSAAQAQNNVTLAAGRNYTVTYAESGSYIVPINETPTDWYNGTSSPSFYVNYSYYYGSTERNISGQSQEGLKGLQDFQPTWTTVIAAFILISILIGLIGTLIYGKMI